MCVCFIYCCLMHYARHANWKRSFAWTSKSLSWSSVFAAATTTWSGPRGPFLKGRDAGTSICCSLFVLRTKHPWYCGDCIDQGSSEQRLLGLCSPEEFHVVAQRKKAKRRNVRTNKEQRRGWRNDLSVDLLLSFVSFYYSSWPQSALDRFVVIIGDSCHQKKV